MPSYRSPGVYIEEIVSDRLRSVAATELLVSEASDLLHGRRTFQWRDPHSWRWSPPAAAFVGLAENGPINVATPIRSFGEFQATYGYPIDGWYLSLAVEGFFANGGQICFVVRIPVDETSTVVLQSAAIPVKDTYSIEARDSAQGHLSVEVVYPPIENDEAPEEFTLVVRQAGREAERYDRLTPRKGRSNVETVVNSASRLISMSYVGGPSTVAERLPAAGTTDIGVNWRVTLDGFIGNVEHRTGLSALEAVDGIGFVAAPDVVAAHQQGVIDLEGLEVVQQAMIDHAERMGDRIAVLDPPADMNAQQIRDWRVERAGYESGFTVLYHPWLRLIDAHREVVNVPPSGHVSGLISHADQRHGSARPPSNMEVRGVVGLEMELTRAERDELHPNGINSIVSIPGRGPVVFGSRTLSTDSARRRLSNRRQLIEIGSTIRRGTQWMLSLDAPDAKLKHADRLVQEISDYLYLLWISGSLPGEQVTDAFLVRCDDETTPPDLVDAGIVAVEIGFPLIDYALRVVYFSG